MFGDLEVRPTLSSETKYSSSNCPNYVRRSRSSSDTQFRKKSIVRRTVLTMFGDLEVRPTLSSETKSSSSSCPNYDRRTNRSPSGEQALQVCARFKVTPALLIRGHDEHNTVGYNCDVQRPSIFNCDRQTPPGFPSTFCVNIGFFL